MYMASGKCILGSSGLAVSAPTVISEFDITYCMCVYT